MASFERRNGKVKAIIRKKVNDGGPKSKTFSSMARARLWAAQRETELTDIAEGHLPNKTLGEAFDRYAREVSPKKKGGRWEVIRLAAIPNTSQHILKKTLPLQQIPPALLAQWRDLRLLEVSEGTVLRELVLLSVVFQRCVREWGWLRENPAKMIAKPAAPAHRDKLLTRQEIRTVLQHLGCNTNNVSGRVGISFLFALRTGMRSGEIVNLRWTDVHQGYVVLPDTKNGAARSVPLSTKAEMIFQRLKGITKSSVFDLTHSSRDALFRKACKRAGLVDVHFHDARHYFATHLAARMQRQGISFIEFVKIMGWKDPKYASVYVNPSASDLAKKLNKRI